MDYQAVMETQVSKEKRVTVSEDLPENQESKGCRASKVNLVILVQRVEMVTM